MVANLITCVVAGTSPNSRFYYPGIKAPKDMQL